MVSKQTDQKERTLWNGRTPTGLSTVARAIRSRNESVAVALSEATGLRTGDAWVATIAQLARSGALKRRPAPFGRV